MHSGFGKRPIWTLPWPRWWCKSRGQHKGGFRSFKKGVRHKT